MRLFIASGIDEKNRKLIHRVQEKFKGCSNGGTFTRKENYHITLRFLGEVEAEVIPKITLAMEMAARESRLFTFSAGSPGYFRRREGVVLFLGIDRGAENLWKIASILEDEFKKGGFPAGHDKFTPHITLGRKVRLRKDFRAIAEELEYPEINVKADAITLMESVREKGLLCYRSLYSAKLML